MAKNLVAAGLAKRCEVQLAYAIGYSSPISVRVDSFSTSEVKNEVLAEAIKKVFDLTPRGIIDALQLERPIYRQTSFGGHFGRKGEDFSWEKTDLVDRLRSAVCEEQKCLDMAKA